MGIPPKHQDLFMARGDNAFPFGDKLFIELLPGPEADVFNLDVHLRLKTGEPNQVPGHLGDLDGGPHFKEEYLAPFTHGPGLEYELACLRDGHKITGHLRVGHRDRAPFFNLLFEKGHHTPHTPLHVAEAHNHKAGIRDSGAVLTLNQQL